LSYKYPTPVANQLALLNFTVYPSTMVPPPPYSFLYFNNAWQEIYTIQPAQYTSVGLGRYDEFTTSNSESSLAGMFNTFIKGDANVMDTIKKGDFEFVSFNYYVSSTKSDYQRVKPLQYDGNNFVAPFTATATATFIKENGTWAPLPIITHTLANSTFGTSSQRTDLGKYGDFSGWSAADLNSAIILVLTADYPSPATNTDYDVIYLNYTGGTDVPTTLAYQWTGTAWQLQ
jgi:hypothetical protein